MREEILESLEYMKQEYRILPDLGQKIGLQSRISASSKYSLDATPPKRGPSFRDDRGVIPQSSDLPRSVSMPGTLFRFLH